MLKDYDEDGDGKLSLTEIAFHPEEADEPEGVQFVEMLKAAFKKADTDDDNLLDVEEVAVLKQLMHKGNEEL